MDHFIRILLMPAQAEYIFVFLTWVCVFACREIYCQIASILLLGVLFNLALKCSFQIPLASHLGKEGFAFPSGHMQAAVILYGWILQSTSRILVKTVIILLLIGVATGLLYFRYHNYQDIVGAILFGIVYIKLYQYILNYNIKITTILNLLIGTMLLIYIEQLYKPLNNARLIYGALLLTNICNYIIRGHLS